MIERRHYVLFIILVVFQFSSYNQSGKEQRFFVSERQKSADIIHYYLKLDLYPEKKIIDGTAIITGVIKDDSSINDSIELNLYDNLEVKKVLFNNAETKFRRSKNKIFLATIEPNDTFVVEISYIGTPKRGGFDGFVFGNVNGNSLIYNISEPNFASTWFPCDDEPSDKALLDIEITNDSQYVSVSNGVLIDTKTSSDRKTYHYKTVYHISTYLIAVYSAEYKSYFDIYTGLDGKDSMKIEYYVMPEHFEKSKVDFAEHLDMMRTLSKLFGEYPFIKEKYGVAEFLWNYGAMENQTITGIGYKFVGGYNFFKDTYVHELAHHWWGNSVGPKTWNDIWLNEGFATYSEALYAEAKHGNDALKSKMLSKFSDNFRGTLFAPKDLFGETVYDKGAWVLHMLRNEIGDSNFFKVLHTYYEKFKYSNASVEDFKKVCEEVSNVDLAKFFDQWVYEGSNNIFCSYTFENQKYDKEYKCTVNLFQEPQDYREFHFPLEIQFQFDDGTNIIHSVYVSKLNESFEFNFEKKVETILPDPDSKLLAAFEKSYSK